jgi:mercuric ion binding protein
MKTLKNIIALAVVVLITLNCKNEAKPEVKTVEVATKTSNTMDPNATYAKAEFTIDGMTCAIGCAKTIEKNISKMEGVKSVTVDFDRKLAMVEYNEAKVTPTSLEETVTKVADIYKVSDMKTVDNFSTIKACNKVCCQGKTDEEKANCKKACCSESDSTNKKACEPGCKKACCTKKAEA